MWWSTSILLLIGYVTAQEYIDGEQSSKTGHLKEIPRRFEVKGRNSIDMFSKYAKDIQKIANQHNFSVNYKVKVDVTKPKPPKKTLKKITSKKVKTKKYNIPLKKQSMKLSNFEILLRKIAEENGIRKKQAENHVQTTDNAVVSQFYNNKILKLIKVKPIINRIKTNYTKIVKPIRNNVITLTS